MVEATPAIVLIVRGLKSKLPRQELERRIAERMPRFRELPGLIQKYYAYDAATDEWSGIYFWDSRESMAGYLESDLRATIASAYELVEPPRVDRFEIVDVLRPPG